MDIPCACVIRKLGMRIEECQEGFKYTSVNSNGELKRSNIAGLMYAYDVFLFAESAKPLQRVCDHVSTVIEEYGLKVIEKKSKMGCIMVQEELEDGKLVAQILMKLKNISIYRGDSKMRLEWWFSKYGR